MSVSVQYATPSGFVVRASGKVTFDEIMKAESDLLADPRLDRASRVLIDGRGVDAAPSATELRVIAREMKPLRDRGVEHIAIVTSNDFVYGVARMFAIFAQASDLMVQTFRDLGEAERWLENGTKPAH